MAVTGSGQSDPTIDGNQNLSAPLIVGAPDFPSPGGTVGLQIQGNSPNYFQNMIGNDSNSANNASSDMVVVADNGNDTAHYADFGINCSGGGQVPFQNATAAYLYSTDNELDIGALGATAAVNIYAGGGTSSPTQKVAMTAAGGVTGVGQTGIIGYLKSANMNITTDNVIPLTLAGASKFAVTSVLLTNPSISLSSAAGGIYTVGTKGGASIVASTQTYTALTTASSLLSPTLTSTATNSIYSVPNLFLSLTTPQGAAATADVYVFGIPLF